MAAQAAWSGMPLRRANRPGGCLQGYSIHAGGSGKLSHGWVVSGAQLIARRRQEFTARKLDAFARTKFAFVVSGDGTGEHWYVPEIMKPWARQAGLASFVGYGFGDAISPGSAIPRTTPVTPPIVDETELHQQLARQLTNSFVSGTGLYLPFGRIPA